MIICSLFFFISRCKTGDRRRYVFRLSLEHSWSAVCRRVGIAGHLRTQNRTFNDFCALYICSLGRIRRRAPERGLQCAIATGRGVSSGYSQTPGAVNIVCTRWDGESLRFFEFASTYLRFLALLTAPLSSVPPPQEQQRRLVQRARPLSFLLWRTIHELEVPESACLRSTSSSGPPFG